MLKIKNALLLLVSIVCIQSIQAIEKENIMHTPLTKEIKVGEKYRHYSGKEYEIIAIAHDSEDPSLLRVVYKGLYDCPSFGPNPIWDRPYTMFAEEVTINGVLQPRFAKIN